MLNEPFIQSQTGLIRSIIIMLILKNLYAFYIKFCSIKAMSIYYKTLVSSVLVVFASIGLGRFSYGMILPDLQRSLDISTTQAGFISTANFIGYLIAIFFVSFLYKKYETYRLVCSSLFLQAISMMGMVLFSNYLVISFFYTFSGFFAALANVSIMIYIAHIIPSHMKGKALGIAVTGIGFGIIFSGFIVPQIEAVVQSSAWKVSWTVFAVLVLLISFFAKAGLQQHDKLQHNNQPEKKSKEILVSLKFYKVAFLYLVFGITYVVYVTFFVTASIDKYNISSYEAGYFWSVLGTMSLFSGPIFGHFSDKIGGYKTLIIIFTFLTIANLILALNLGSNFLWVSAVLFGLSAWAVPSLITLLSSQEFGVQNTAKVFSLATLLFSTGQAIGPFVAGYMYDLKGDFSIVFLICSGITTSAIVASFIFSLNAQKDVNL